MRIETSTPVYAGQFFDRDAELRQLREVVNDATGGVRRWVAVLGHRKIGKTSLLVELLRRHSSELVMPYVDCWEVRADPLQFLRRMSEALLRAVVRRRRLEAEVGPLDAGEDGRLPSRVVQVLARLAVPAVDATVRVHESVSAGRVGVATLRKLVELPGALAAELDEPLVVILDEFQELERLSKARRLGQLDDVFGLLRSIWQHQQGVSYIVAGSRLSLLHRILLAETSAFFQHFELMRLGPFAPAESARMLRMALAVAADRPPSRTERDVLELLGHHPFYIRAVARAAVSPLSPLSADGSDSEEAVERALREALEATLFDVNGRLSLYMEQRYRLVVGESSMLEAVLRGFAKPARISDVAKTMHVQTGVVSNAVKKLIAEDILVKRSDGRYQLIDPTFGLWLEHQVDFRRAMPPLLVGTESEQAVARRLAADGFRGVYQSKASRGAFDLLAIHDTRVFGLQVKTAKLPFGLRAQEKTRLIEDGRRLGFRAVLALVTADGSQVRFYDLDAAPARGGWRLRDDTAWVESLLALL